MTSIKCAELLCGKAVISQAFRERNHQAVSLDIRKRKGVCEPDIHLDILRVESPRKMFLGVNVVWFSPPCQCWSYASGSYHFFEGSPQTKSTRHLISVLEKGLRIIEELMPVVYYIENPQGKLRYYKSMIDFLIRTSGMIKKCSYYDYGFPSPKPTNIFTNDHALELKSTALFGRGAKYPNANLNNMSIIARQEVPRTLANEIVFSAERYYKNLPGTSFNMQYEKREKSDISSIQPIGESVCNAL